METILNDNSICERDKEHQEEWREFFEKCFDKNGNYIEENAEKFMADLETKHNKKKEIKKVSVQVKTEQVKTFG